MPVVVLVASTLAFWAIYWFVRMGGVDHFREQSKRRKQDERRARSRHWQAGGSIMIHGLPNWPRHEPEYYVSHDWTDGCIAVTDQEIEEIWGLVRDGTPVEIRP